MKKCYSECILWEPSYTVGFPGGAVVKNLPASAGDSRDLGSILGLGQPPAVGNGNPLQYSCLENSTDNGACQAIVHGVAKSQMQLSMHALLHCWWESKLVQPLWRTEFKLVQPLWRTEFKLVQPLWRTVNSFIQLKIEVLYDPAILVLGIYPGKTII